MREEEIEIWKDIPKYEGRYQVSNWGNVKTLGRLVEESNGRKVFRKEKLLTKSLMYKGYEVVKLYKTKEQKNTMFVHKLVGITFLENPNNFVELNHKNGIKTDNRVKNLEWCSRSFNVKETYRLGLRNPNTYKGEGNKSSKLTEESVLKIREEYSKGGVSFSQLGKKYNIGTSNIGMIISRASWKHI